MYINSHSTEMLPYKSNNQGEIPRGLMGAMGRMPLDQTEPMITFNATLI